MDRRLPLRDRRIQLAIGVDTAGGRFVLDRPNEDQSSYDRDAKANYACGNHEALHPIELLAPKCRKEDAQDRYSYGDRLPHRVCL